MTCLQEEGACQALCSRSICRDTWALHAGPLEPKTVLTEDVFRVSIARQRHLHRYVHVSQTAAQVASHDENRSMQNIVMLSQIQPLAKHYTYVFGMGFERHDWDKNSLLDLLRIENMRPKKRIQVLCPCAHELAFNTPTAPREAFSNWEGGSAAVALLPTRHARRSAV